MIALFLCGPGNELRNHGIFAPARRAEKFSDDTIFHQFDGDLSTPHNRSALTPALM